MFPLNVQPVEKFTNRQDGALDIVKIWYTIQGEGPFAGKPAVFIRMAGCDLQCPDCDTDYTSNRMMMSPELVAEACLRSVPETTKSRKGSPPLIVLTGGEPFRQNFGPAVRALIDVGFYNVQIETNGTLWQDDAPIIPMTVVCSPKTPVINQKLKPYIKNLKYVIEAGKVDEVDGLPLSGVLGSKLGPPCRPWHGFGGTVWVQPLDLQDPLQNKDNIKATVEVAMKYGYRLSLQTHKIIGVE